MSNKRTALSDEDIALFRKAVANVRRLGEKTNVPGYQDPASREQLPPSEPITNGPIAHPAKQDERLLFQRPGVQERLMRRLKKGQLKCEARLDLHGLTGDEAAPRIAQFLEDCQYQRLTCVLIIHGKGIRSGSGEAILKSKVNSWLRQHSAILAFSSALPADGGAGAMYVLLRKRSGAL